MAQDYEALREICFATNKLFEDPLFAPPPADTAGSSEVKWLRPHQITRGPKFIYDGAARFDVEQGALGDCWMVSAMANLTLNERLFDRVVPPDQSFEPSQYCGMFRFRFWRFGNWLEVIVDDRLPVKSSSHAPMYVHSTDADEFWSPLLEKAYAKLYKSYEALTGGDFCEAMVDFTGGIAERYDIKREDGDRLWSILMKSHKRGSLMGCGISRSPGVSTFGLVNTHAYSITGLAWLKVSNLSNHLIRIRNPHGRGEWNGAWSDRSHKWFELTEEVRAGLGLVVRDDGEFWMSFADWRQQFTSFEVCHLTPDSVESDVEHYWHTALLEGSWIWGLTSGGSRTLGNDKEFAMNPQYFVKLTQPDKDDPDRCTLVVSLMHREHRSQQSASQDRLTKGVYIYPISNKYKISNNRLGADFFLSSQPVDLEPKFSTDREIVSRYRLAPGRYVIVPTTYDMGEEGKFLLRVWTEQPVKCMAAPALPARYESTPSRQASPANLNGWISLALQSREQTPQPSPTQYRDKLYDILYIGKPKIVSKPPAQPGPSRLKSIPMRRNSPIYLARVEPAPEQHYKRPSFWRILLAVALSDPKKSS